MDRMIERSAAVEALTPDERAMLETQLVWVTCPVCEGSVVGKALGHFCMACGTRGQVLKSTANVLSNMMPFIEAWRKRDAEPRFTREDVSFQERVKPWMDACFGEVISGDKVERADRFLEEVFELLQSGGYDPNRIPVLASYVWNRPTGEPAQEVGGVMVTLAAYCLAHTIDMHEAGETELDRIWTKVEQIRAKQAAKARDIPLSPLPAALSAIGDVDHG